MIQIIKNGTVVTSETEFKGDILIDGETIRQVGTDINIPADHVIDASGKYVMPGGVDQHTHFGSFGGMLFETTAAAAVGGTTTIVDFAPQEKEVSLGDAIEAHAAKAEGVSCVDYAFHSMVMDITPDTFHQIEQLPRHGVSSVKMFTAYKNTPFYMEDENLIRAMLAARKAGVTMMVHAENADIITIETERLLREGKTAPVNHFYARPPIAETEAVRHVIALAKFADCPLMVMHVSTTGAMKAIRKAQEKGLKVQGETCTQYLTLDTSYLERGNFEGANYVCAPPLRPKKHSDGLWTGIKKGWINSVSSDHCAVLGGSEAKKRGAENFSKIPNGIPGVQNRLEMLWSQGVARGRISRQRFVDLTATMPARNLGLVSKGQLAPGFDADILIYDPDYRGTITQSDNLEGLDYTVYEGFEMIGRPDKVFLRGRLVADGGRFTGDPGFGRHISASPYAQAYS